MPNLPDELNVVSVKRAGRPASSKSLLTGLSNGYFEYMKTFDQEPAFLWVPKLYELAVLKDANALPVVAPGLVPYFSKAAIIERAWLTEYIFTNARFLCPYCGGLNTSNLDLSYYAQAYCLMCGGFVVETCNL
jgi:hypothetical protein